jgi:hypothetical protein
MNPVERGIRDGVREDTPAATALASITVPGAQPPGGQPQVF